MLFDEYFYTPPLSSLCKPGSVPPRSEPFTIHDIVSRPPSRTENQLQPLNYVVSRHGSMILNRSPWTISHKILSIYILRIFNAVSTELLGHVMNLFQVGFYKAGDRWGQKTQEMDSAATTATTSNGGVRKQTPPPPLTSGQANALTSSPTGKRGKIPSLLSDEPDLLQGKMKRLQLQNIMLDAARSADNNDASAGSAD